MADARQAKVTPKALRQYAERLSEFDMADVLEVIGQISVEPRNEWEKAFPGLGDIVSRVKSRIRERRTREATHLKLEQQERQFWEMVDYQCELTGKTEQEVLNEVKTPGYTGRKARGDRGQQSLVDPDCRP